MKIIKNGVLGLFVFGIAVLVLRAQQKPAAAKPEAVVQEWFARWNALDGSDGSVQRLLDLYQANAMHEVGPNTKQIGPVFLDSQVGLDLGEHPLITSPRAVSAAKARRVNRLPTRRNTPGSATIEDNSLKRCCFYGKAAPPRGQIAGHRL